MAYRLTLLLYCCGAKTTKYVAVTVCVIFYLTVSHLHLSFKNIFNKPTFYSKCRHLHDCAEECFVHVLEVVWPGIQRSSSSSSSSSKGISWGFAGTAECVFASCDRGPLHACTQSQTHTQLQLCSVWAPRERIYPAFPSRCQSRQPSFDSLTFQF